MVEIGRWKGMLHVIFVKCFLCLSLMMILELLVRQWNHRMEKIGKSPWLRNDNLRQE